MHPSSQADSPIPGLPAASPGSPTAIGSRGSDLRAHTAEAALQEILAEGSRASVALGFGYRRLWANLADATEGGKRVRRALFSASYQAWGGTDIRAAAAIGAAIELLHTAFVVHDDVIDGDDIRRGRPNVSGSHARQARARGVDDARARQYGAAAGILAGDLALAAALRSVATCRAPSPVVHQLLDLFDSVLHITAAGELADVRLSLGLELPTLEEALTVQERKTSVYSFALPLQAGAVLAGAPEAAGGGCGEVGRSLGIAFQLVDDLLGVFGDAASTGKSVLNDLRSGKQTPLITHARSTEQWPAIAPYVGRADLTESQGALVREQLTACGSRRFVESLARDYAHDAIVSSVDVGLPPALVFWITVMTEELLERAAA